MPPRILHVFSTFDVGGPQVRYAQLANEFGRLFRHYLFAMDGKYGCRDRLGADLDVNLVEVPVSKGHTLRNARNFRRTLREVRPDLLVTYNWGAIEWAMANWPRLIRHVHIEDGFGPEEATRQLPRRVWTRRLVLRGSTVVMPSLTLARLATEVWRLSSTRVRYVPNGINCARFVAPPDNSASPPWAGPYPVIGTVAALRREKNLGRLIRAVRQVMDERPCRLVIVGDGPERTGLEALAFEEGIRDHVFFTGYISDPATLYRSFDIVGMSSDTEQMPYTVIEAMASSLPVVSTHVGDIPDMVSSENLPFLTPRADAALARAIKSLVEDRELRLRIGAANRKKVLSDYDERQMFAAYRALFEGYDV